MSLKLSKLLAVASQSLAILPDWVRRSQPNRLSMPKSTYHLVACLVGTGSVVLVNQTTDEPIRFVTTPATCPRRYGHSSWTWYRSDATALAGYANMMIMMMMMIMILQQFEFSLSSFSGFSFYLVLVLVLKMITVLVIYIFNYYQQFQFQFSFSFQY